MLKKQKNIRFSGSGPSNQNGAAERDIKMVFTMARTMLMHYDLRFSDDTFSTDIWEMEIYYSVWIYNWIPYMHPGLSVIGIW